MSHITDALLMNLIRLIAMQLNKDGYRTEEVYDIVEQSGKLFYTPPPNIEDIIKKYANMKKEK